ncbi:carcinoembryonic antigen-related cell adhesion molecule 3-like [Phyllostomus discolor]|uniref:Carcinoembryonic antigen-related cell adhesion molecule 3-like n=1 Tax=Phyllostomus discolor TaxID=89673 RepID=A0A7E6CP73_9CHIR|nr:carcinoembryonic antigen-related cell adhesion molecule 3-like [Phyllostomus discolor]
MGSPSVSTHRGHVHWQGLLLVVSLLNFWSQPTTAQVTVESIEAVEGTNVTLHIHHNAQNAASFMWYRGETAGFHNNIAYLSVSSGRHVRGPPNGQGIVEDDGSLLLQNVTMNDSGIYTILILQEGCQQMISCGWLDVYPLVSMPTLLASNTRVTENKDAVVLTCHTSADFIQWLFNGTNLRYTNRMKLSLDRRNLTIDPVQRWDAGNYQCKASNRMNSAESAYVGLDVIFE